MRPRVLVLDDEADIRRLLRDTPTDEGMEVTEAADGLEALQSLAEALEPFDVILLDLTPCRGWTAGPSTRSCAPVVTRAP